MYICVSHQDILIFPSGVPHCKGLELDYVFISLIMVSFSAVIPRRVEVLGCMLHKVGKLKVRNFVLQFTQHQEN